MAITLLGKGASPITFVSVAKTLTLAAPLVAGSNRRLIVAVNTSVNQSVDQALSPTVAYGGVPMSLLSRPDGALAFLFEKAAGFPVWSSVHVFGLLESELIAAVGTNIVASFPTVSSIGGGFLAAYWLLGNCDQGLSVRDHRRFSTTSTVAVSFAPGSTQPGGTSDAVIVAAKAGANSGTLDILINGAGGVEDYDVGGLSVLGRVSGRNVTAAGVFTGVSFSSTFVASTVQAAILIAVRLAEFFQPNGQASLSQAPGSTVTLEPL